MNEPNSVADTAANPASQDKLVPRNLPDLRQKKVPSQQRAVETFERILAACGDLLGEVGIERLSTNLVCQRAGISPPALYQYFPNKYAILCELAERLMRSQNALLTPWATAQTWRLPEPELAASIADLFIRTLQLTEQMPAGIWITRALRAVPTLQEVRHSSHELVTDLLVHPFMQAYPQADQAEVRLTLRLGIDALYAAQELLFDNPRLDPRAVARTMAAMVTGQLVKLRQSE